MSEETSSRVRERAARIVRSFPMFHRSEETDERLTDMIAAHPRRLVDLARLAAEVALRK